MAFCRKCGTELEPGARFCEFCGAEVRAAAPPPAPPPPAQEPPKEPPSLPPQAPAAPKGPGFFSRHKKALLVACLVVLVVAAAAVAAVFLVPRYFGEGAQRRKAVHAIAEFAGHKVDADYRGKQAYLGGEVMRFTSTTTAGPVDYYVDPKTNRVMRMDDFNSPAYQVKIDEAAAQKTATDFARAHFADFAIAGLQATSAGLVDHGENTEKYFAYTWIGKDPQSGAILPVAVSVRVGATDDQVFSYNSVDVPVTVSTQPKVSQDQAEQAALAAAKGVPKAKVKSTTLAVATDPPNDPRGRQALVWQVVVEGSSAAGYATGAFVYVDAQSGKVLKVDPFS